METELNWDRGRPSLAQDPDLRPAIQRRPAAGAAARGRAASGRIAQRLIRRAEDVVASGDYDLIVAVMPGLSNSSGLDAVMTNVISRNFLDRLRRRPIASLLRRRTIGKRVDRE